MSIVTRQMSKALDRIIKGILQKGYLPSVRELEVKLRNYFSDKIPGSPTFRLRLAPYRGKSSSRDWNDNVDEIKEDLDTIYEETVDQAERILVNFNYIEAEKRRMDHRMRNIEDRVQELLLLNKNSDGYLYSFTDSFTDLGNTDLEHTTSFVDLRAGEVTPMQTKAGTTRVDLSTASINGVIDIAPEDVVSSTEVSPMANALDDIENTAWLQKVIVKQKRTKAPVDYKITITPSNAQAVTRILIKPHNTDKTKFAVRVTEDGINWRTVYSDYILDQINVDLPEIQVSGLELTLSKSQCDDVDDLGNETFYFGICTVGMVKIGFEDVADYVTKPITIKDRQGRAVNVSKLSLEVDQAISSPSNWIKYYVAVEDPAVAWADIDWQLITPINIGEAVDLSAGPNRPPQVIDFKAINKTLPIQFDSSSAVSYDMFNGLNIWAFSGLNPNHSIITDTMQLCRGYRQWRMEYYDYQWDGDDTAFNPSMEDWLTPPVESKDISVKFVSLDGIPSTYKTQPDIKAILVAQRSKCNYRWVTNMKSDTEKDVTLTITANRDCYISLYINNSEVLQTKGYQFKAGSPLEVKISFTPGWNNLCIQTYNSSDQALTIDLGIRPLLNIANKILADVEPLGYVSEFDLCYNVAEGETTRYSIKESDNRLLINNEMKLQGAAYDLTYQYYPGDNVKSIIVRAELGKEAGTTQPPKLRSYKLRVGL
jgi:hypothetical protein